MALWSSTETEHAIKAWSSTPITWRARLGSRFSLSCTVHPMIDQRANQRSGTSLGWQLPLVLILVLAAGLRSCNLGQLSFWYDEVVTMRLAEAPTPAALVHRLLEIDATRAPLHPLLLQAWVRVFGSSEAAARSFSVLCGVATVGLVCWLGRLLFDERTGLWAAYLTALSPPLVYYSREARMYAWLVMTTCVCWGLLFSQSRIRNGEFGIRNSERRMRKGEGSRSRLCLIGYSLALTGLLYSHPLGLLMAGTLALGSLCFARQFFGGWARWLAAHLTPLILAAPWLGHYFDHAPEFLTGRLPLSFLIGTPIGFIGGNFLVLLGVVVLAGFGLIRRRADLDSTSRCGAVCLVLWLIVPPSLLYAYSWIGNPVFGPARYTLFVAPAFLILTARGLAILPRLPRLALGFALSLLAAASLGPSVYAPGLKADWRALAQEIRDEIRSDRDAKIRVVVKSTDPTKNVEVETARYYLPRECLVFAWEEFMQRGQPEPLDGKTYLAIGVKAGVAEPPADDRSWVQAGRYPGLVVYRVGQPAPAAQPAGPAPARPGGSGRG